MILNPKVSGNEQKQKYSMSKPIGYCKAIPRGMCIVINIYNRERKRERERGRWKENGKKE